MKLTHIAWSAVAGLCTATLLAQPLHALAQLPPMRVVAAGPLAEPVPQTGANADALRRNLSQIALPPGFRIALYAVVPGARHMALAPSGEMLFVGTRDSTVWAVTDRQHTGVANEVRAFAPALGFKSPNGVCWSLDGALVVAEINRVRIFPAAESSFESPQVTVGDIVPQGQLAPPTYISAGHGARTCRVGPDNKLYVTVGQPYNVPPADKYQELERLGVGALVRMQLDGSGREIYARGIRNSVGQDFNPQDGTLWWTDNQTDGLGNDVPPGELNRSTRAGQHFGYPYWNGHFKVAGSAVAADLRDMPEPANAVFPEIEFPAHQAQLGMVFYTGSMFPSRYRGGIFVAAHGSWNRSPPSGALVNFVSLKADGRANTSEVFAQGWLRPESGTYTGRPVDVAVLPDGSLLISDDHAGAIYRVSYGH